MRRSFAVPEPKTGAYRVILFLGVLAVLQAVVFLAHAVWCAESWLVDQVLSWF